MQGKQLLLGLIGALALGGSVFAATPSLPDVPKAPDMPKVPDVPSSDTVRETRNNDDMTRSQTTERQEVRQEKSQSITDKPGEAVKDTERRVKGLFGK